MYPTATGSMTSCADMQTGVLLFAILSQPFNLSQYVLSGHHTRSTMKTCTHAHLLPRVRGGVCSVQQQVQVIRGSAVVHYPRLDYVCRAPGQERTSPRSALLLIVVMPSTGSKKRANPEGGGADGEPSSHVPPVISTEEMQAQPGGTVSLSCLRLRSQ